MREQKITLGEMRQSGVHGLLVYCSDYRCSHLVKLGPAEVDRWSDGVRLSDLEPDFDARAAAVVAPTSGQTFRRPGGAHPHGKCWQQSREREPSLQP